MSMKLSIIGLAALGAAGLCSHADQLELKLKDVAVGTAEQAATDAKKPPADAGEKKEKPKGKYGLPEEDEKSLLELVNKAAVLKRNALEKELKGRAKEIAEKAKLSEEAAKKLETLMPAALDAVMAEWGDHAASLLAPLILPGGGAEKALRSWKAGSLMADRRFSTGTAPEETQAWKDGLKTLLSAEQLAAFEADEKERRVKLIKEFKDYLDASEDNAGQSIDAVMDKQLQSILLYGSIDEERSKKLKEAAATAAKETIKSWRARAEKKILAMDSASRERLTQNNGLMGLDPTESDNKPEGHNAWKDAVSTLLREEERKAVEGRREEVKKRRARALAMMIVGDADRYLGLSEEQQLKLLDLGVEPMTKLPSHYFESPESGGHYSIDVGDMLQKMREAAGDKVKEFLSEPQLKRWKDLTAAHLSHNAVIRQSRAGEEKVEDETDVEKLVSKFLYNELKSTRQRLQSMLEARIEIIQRICKPDDKALAILRTAAKGAVEQWASDTMRNLEGWVRGQFINIKPADVAARLNSLYNPYVNDRSQLVDPKVWTAAIDRVLTKEQRDAWKAESETRNGWRSRSISEMTITEAEKRIIIKPELLDEMRTKLAEVLLKYEQDISNYFSYGWHLQGYYSCIPFALLEDAELEKFFGKEQMDTVNDKLLPNARRYADTIKQQHKNRNR